MAKSKNTDSSQLEDMETEIMKEKRGIREIHSYACQTEEGGECFSSPNTPAKQKTKKAKNDTQANEPTLSEVQNVIITAVIQKINERADQTDKAVQYNTVQIDDIKKSLEFCHEEAVALKKQNSTLQKQCDLLGKKVNELELKVNETDRYSRRLNLRLYGVHETNKDDNIKKEIQEVVRAVLPDSEAGLVVAAIDVVHRIGNLHQRGERANLPPRPLIIRFLSRTARDAVWRGSKNSSYLKNKKLNFKEDLTAADKEIRSRLWPAVEEARKRGEKAFFVGNRAYVNGKEIKI